MRVAIVGAGRIGGNCARRFAKAGHDVVVTFARDRARLEELAAEIGATVAKPAQAVASAEVVVLSVPWGVIPEALEQAGRLEGKVVIDTTNQFGPGGALELPGGQTAAQLNASRMVGARYTKSFNTLTSGFQAATADREGTERVVQWLCGDDTRAKVVASRLIADAGYVPVDLGGAAECAVMEAPRRPGAVYGEEYREAEAQAVVEALRAGREIPPTPTYDT